MLLCVKKNYQWRLHPAIQELVILWKAVHGTIQMHTMHPHTRINKFWLKIFNLNTPYHNNTCKKACTYIICMSMSVCLQGLDSAYLGGVLLSHSGYLRLQPPLLSGIGQLSPSLALRSTPLCGKCFHRTAIASQGPVWNIYSSLKTVLASPAGVESTSA